MSDKMLVITDEMLKKLESVNYSLNDNRGKLFGAFLITAIPVAVAAGMMFGAPGVGIIIAGIFIGTGGAAFGLNLIRNLVNERRDLLSEKKEIIEQLKKHQTNLDMSLNSKMVSKNPLFYELKNTLSHNENKEQNDLIVNALNRERDIQGIHGFFKRLSGAGQSTVVKDANKKSKSL